MLSSSNDVLSNQMSTLHTSNDQKGTERTKISLSQQSIALFLQWKQNNVTERLLISPELPSVAPSGPSCCVS